MDALLMMAGAFAIGTSLGWALGTAYAKTNERARVVEWLKQDASVTDKVVSLIAMGAHEKPNDTMRREG